MTDRSKSFTSARLQARLSTYPRVRRYLVGFSGGADSTALLTALHRLREALQASISAIHFNHGLDPDSLNWQRHCERFCRERGIPLECVDLALSRSDSNLENKARDLRYRHVESLIDSDTIYLTGHNADDRVETLLLNALRGSGLEGMAAIPEIRRLGPGHVARPLLEFSRHALATFLRNNDIEWIEDPSNRDVRMDRNFLRHEVIPLLEVRWPAARATLAQTAAHCETGRLILRNLLAREAGLNQLDRHILPTEALHRFGEEGSALILREWLRRAGAPPLPRARLMEFLTQLSRAGDDAQCEVAWAGWGLRRFREELRLIPPGECPECPQREWRHSSELDLGPGLGALRLRGSKTLTPTQWTVGPRRPGGRIRLHANGPNRKLKKVFQDQPIPPWQRNSIPVLYWDDRAMAIGDWSLAPELGEWLEENGLEYDWQPENEALWDTRARCHEFLAGDRLA